MRFGRGGKSTAHVVEPVEPERAYVTRVGTWWGDLEWRCEAGQTERPVGCERHRDHYWCHTCQGYYGVPHDFGMHEGPHAHPYQLSGDRGQCACRPCKQSTGRE